MLTAERIYHLANGEYTVNLDALDLQMPGYTQGLGGTGQFKTKNYDFTVFGNHVVAGRRADSSPVGSYVLTMSLEPNGSIKRLCTPSSNAVCLSMGADWQS